MSLSLSQKICAKDVCGEVLRFNQGKVLEKILNISRAACKCRGKILKVSSYMYALIKVAKAEKTVETIAALEKLLDPVDELFLELSNVTAALTETNEHFSLLIHDLFENPCIKLTPEELDLYGGYNLTILANYDALREFLDNDYIQGTIIVQDNLKSVSDLIYKPEEEIGWAIIKTKLALIKNEVDLFIVSEKLFKDSYQTYQDIFYEFRGILLDDGYLDVCKEELKFIRC